MEFGDNFTWTEENTTLSIEEEKKYKEEVWQEENLREDVVERLCLIDLISQEAQKQRVLQ